LTGIVFIFLPHREYHNQGKEHRIRAKGLGRIRKKSRAGCSTGSPRRKPARQPSNRTGPKSKGDVETEGVPDKTAAENEDAEKVMRRSKWIDEDSFLSSHLDFGTGPGQPVAAAPKNE
jgi:hypothetical protein